MKTTVDCKKFLVDFFKQEPNLICKLFEGYECEIAYKFSQDINNWKREIKCKPGSDNSYINDDKVEYFAFGKSYSKRPNNGSDDYIKVSQVVSERHFILKEDVLGTGVRFIILETTSSELLLGEYIGD